MEVSQLWFLCTWVMVRALRRFERAHLCEEDLRPRRLFNRWCNWYKLDEHDRLATYIHIVSPDLAQEPVDGLFVTDAEPEPRVGWQMDIEDKEFSSSQFRDWATFKLLGDGVEVRKMVAGRWHGELPHYNIFDVPLAYHEAILLLPYYLTHDGDAILEMVRALCPGRHQLDLSALSPEQPDWWRDPERLEQLCREVGERHYRGWLEVDPSIVKVIGAEWPYQLPRDRSLYIDW